MYKNNNNESLKSEALCINGPSSSTLRIAGAGGKPYIYSLQTWLEELKKNTFFAKISDEGEGCVTPFF